MNTRRTLWRTALTLFLASMAGIASAQPTFNKVWSWNLTTTSGGLSMELRNITEPTDVQFVYGTDAALAGGTVAGKSRLPAVTTGIQSHAELKGLKPGTLYHFKAFASNSKGKAEMAGQFTTLKADPPKISGISHSTVTYNGALLSMTLQTNEASNSHFLYGTDANLAGAEQSRTQPVTGSDKTTGSHHDVTPNLKPATTYYYQAIVSNPYGTSKSGIQSFKTAAGGPKAPTVTRIWSWNLKNTSAGLSMEIQNYGVASAVLFEYGKDAALKDATKAGASNVKAYATGVQSHVELKNLQPNTTYYYRASATSSSGTAQSGISSFKTAP